MDKAEQGTEARRDQIVAELELLNKDLQSTFAAANPKAFADKAKKAVALSEELDTYYND